MPITFIDDLGFEITLKKVPKTVISTVPSITELLFYLGLDSKIWGRTKFCIHPMSGVQNIPIVGGTKNLNVEKIISLNPELIIANKEENLRDQIEALKDHFPVFVTDIKTIDDAQNMIHQISLIFRSQVKAQKLLREIAGLKTNFNMAEDKHSVAYIIWNNPMMTVGADTFIHDMLTKNGFNNKFENKNRYPVISIQELKALKPDLVFLSSEPFPFNQSSVIKKQLEMPDSRVILVDGEMFSWYGNRMLSGMNYIQSLVKSI